MKESKPKKIMVRVIGGVGILLIFLLGFLLLLPSIINLGPVKERILAEISKKVGGRVNFQRIDISLLHRTHVVIHQASLSIPGKITGTLATATLYPEILPLLRGKIRISSIQIETPNITLPLPEKPPEKEEKAKNFSPEIISQFMTPLLVFMESALPNLKVRIEKGKLNLLKANHPVFWFRDIQATMILPPERLEFDLSGQSNLCEKISIKGWVDSKNLRIKGDVEVTDLRPNLLTGYLSHSLPWEFGDSRIDLKLAFQTEGQEILQAEIRSSIPYLTLQRGGEKLVLKGGKLKGAFRMEGNKSEVSLAEFNLEDPRVTIAGKLQIDSAAPFIRVEVEGRGIDLTSTRIAALALAGDVHLVQEIFDIVRGGKIPRVTFQTKGRSPGDLGKIENLFIRGNITEGKAFISEAMVGLKGLSFDLEEIKGEVMLSRGILEAKNLEARWGDKVKVKEGLLRWGLEGGNGPFHLEAMSEVDLAPIPALLKQLVKDETLLKEIEFIQEIKGQARGKWVLGETLKTVGVKVDVQEINLLTRYARFPYPLELQSAQVSYDGRKLGIKELNAKFGRSSLSGLTAELDLKAGPDLEVLCGESAILLDEIFPWLSSLEKFKGVTKDLQSLKGTVALSAMNWEGPIFDPEKWRFHITGEVEDLFVELALLPGPVSVPGAKFEITPDKFSLSDVRMHMLDASLRAGGVLHGYQRGLRRVDFTFQGDIGSKLMDWGFEQFRLPAEFRIRPLSISQAQVAWDRNGKTAFTGNIAGKEGPRISLDMFYRPEEFTINRMLIQDEKSQAVLALALQKRELHLDFKGNVEKATLDQFLVKNEVFRGSLKGDFRAHILVDQPLRSTAQGKLRATGLDYPLPGPVPVTINDFSLDAAQNKVKFESASFTWDGHHLALNGDVNFSAEGILLDMEVSADGFKWEKVEKELKKEDQRKGKPKTEKQKVKDQKIDSAEDPKALLPPVRGKIRVKLKYFEYEKYTLKPLYADLLLDPDGVKVVVHEANLCGISIPGMVKVMLPDISLDFQPVSRGQELQDALGCLLGKQVGMTGNFDFQGEIRARAKPEELLQSLQGNFALEAQKGQIYRESLVVKILTVLNITDIFFGEHVELDPKGAGYDSIKVKGNLQSGKFMLNEVVMNAPWMKMVSEGEIDLINQKIDLTFILAPLKTVDQIISHIPIVGNILGGTFISIPVRVRGDLKDPKIIPLSPSAIGEGLIGVMKRTLSLPFKLIQPVIPR